MWNKKRREIETRGVRLIVQYTVQKLHVPSKRRLPTSKLHRKAEREKVLKTVANPLRLESWKGRDIEQYPDGRCSGRVLTF